MALPLTLGDDCVCPFCHNCGAATGVGPYGSFLCAACGAVCISPRDSQSHDIAAAIKNPPDWLARFLEEGRRRG